MAVAKKPNLGKWKDFRLEGLEELKESQDSKYYRNLLDDVKEGLAELVKVGADFEVFQNAKHAQKALNQAYKLVNKVN